MAYKSRENRRDKKATTIPASKRTMATANLIGLQDRLSDYLEDFGCGFSNQEANAIKMSSKPQADFVIVVNYQGNPLIIFHNTFAHTKRILVLAHAILPDPVQIQLLNPAKVEAVKKEIMVNIQTTDNGIQPNAQGKWEFMTEKSIFYDDPNEISVDRFYQALKLVQRSMMAFLAIVKDNFDER